MYLNKIIKFNFYIIGMLIFTSQASYAQPCSLTGVSLEALENMPCTEGQTACREHRSEHTSDSGYTDVRTDFVCMCGHWEEVKRESKTELCKPGTREVSSWSKYFKSKSTSILGSCTVKIDESLSENTLAPIYDLTNCKSSGQQVSRQKCVTTSHWWNQINYDDGVKRFFKETRVKEIYCPNQSDKKDVVVIEEPTVCSSSSEKNPCPPK